MVKITEIVTDSMQGVLKKMVCIEGFVDIMKNLKIIGKENQRKLRGNVENKKLKEQ